MLQSGALAVEAAEFADGEELANLPGLRHFMAELRFGYCAERLAEGGHTTVHLAAQGARNRSESYDSLALRLPAVKLALSDKSQLAALLDALDTVRTPTAVIRALGLVKHPSYKLARTAWDA